MLHTQRDRLEHFGVNVANNPRAGLATTMEQIGAAEQARKQIWKTFREFFGRYDHLLTPTMAVPPFSGAENYPSTVGGRKMETYVDWIAPTFVLSLTGLPVASVPAGMDSSGFPTGLQIVAPPQDEEKALVSGEVANLGVSERAG